MGVLLTDAGEGVEEEEETGGGEEGSGVGVELRAERGGLTVEPWTSALTSKVADPSH